jgi:putative protein-disulfide isomerase
MRLVLCRFAAITGCCRAAGLDVQLHAGGMMSGSRRQAVTPALRDYVMPHDQRIASLTGLSFGQDYFDGLLRDETAVFDSTPPIAAILLAEQLGLPDLAMLSVAAGPLPARTTHCRPGRAGEACRGAGTGCRRLCCRLAQAIQQADAHIQHSRSLMQQFRLQGFPSLLLEKDGQWQRLDVSPWLGQPDAFATALQQELLPAAEQSSPACSVDGCQLPD